MKILIPNRAGIDSFDDNVAHTLELMGHTVVRPDRILSRTGHPAIDLGRQMLAKAFPRRWTPLERWAMWAAREHRPQLLLSLTTSLRQEVLEEIRQYGVERLVAWWGDPPANMQGMGLLAPGWDAIFLKDAAAVAKFRAVGLTADLLHEAMNPTWHKRRFDDIGTDVVVAGNYYGFRQYLVECLMRAGVPMALYGPPPPRWAGEAIRRAHRGRYIVREEKAYLFGAGLACLNSTDLSEGDSLNCRAFEIAGACGLQLIEDKPVVPQCFEPGAEVLVYRTVSEIVDYVQQARREPAWALAIREAGHRRAHAHHTYEKRLQTILKYVGFNRPASSLSTA